MKGYFYLEMGTNACFINDDVTSVNIEKVWLNWINYEFLYKLFKVLNIYYKNIIRITLIWINIINSLLIN